MKFFVGFCLILQTFTTSAQDGVYQVDFYKTPLNEALKQVEAQYNLKFSFDPELIKQKTITVRIRETKIQKFTDQFLESVPFNIRKLRDVYLILPEHKPVSRNLLGKVTDADNGSPLAYAVIQLEGKGVITDQNGLFSVKVPRDSVEITVNYLGYTVNRRWVSPFENNLTVRLQANDNQLPEFIIDGNRSSINKLAGFSSINPNQISTLPSLGETDIFKGLQLLPGITATDESESGLTVRGGSPDQNLVLLDGFTIYHLDHFFGIFSTFNPHTINHVDIYKGGFDVKYGGRVSAVVDAKAKAWTSDKISGGIGVNGSSASGYIQSPIGKKSFLNMGLRWSHYDVVNNPLYNKFIEKNRVDAINADNPAFTDIRSRIKLEPKFSFYDFNAKWRYAPNNSATWDFNIYLSDDSYSGFRGIDFGISFFEVLDKADWSNAGLSANWMKDWNSKSSSEMTISASSYGGSSTLQNKETFEKSVDVSLADDFLFRDGNTIVYQDFSKSNTISDITLKWHHNFQPNAYHRLSFGTELKNIDTRFSILFSNRSDNISDLTGNVASLYFSDNFTKGKFAMTGGVRHNYISQSKKHFLEPRFNFSYDLSERFTLFGNYSFHNQFINRVSISPFGNSDQFYWVLANDEEYPIIRSRHLIFGISFNEGKWSVDAEAYRKSTDGILESRFALESNFNGLVKPEEDNLLLPAGSNKTYGIDFLVKRKTNRYIAWISYTLATSRNRFELLNNGNPFASNTDQRHEINWVNIYKTGRWEFSSVFIYGSGRPYTSRGEVSTEKIILFDVTNFNAFRIPDYHRLDLSAKYKTSIGKLKVESGITLFNIYNRENIKSRRFSLRYNLDDAREQITSVTAFPMENTLLGFTPNFFLNVDF